MVQHKSKRSLSSNLSENMETIKKSKPIFKSLNKFVVLANENDETENTEEILIDSAPKLNKKSNFLHLFYKWNFGFSVFRSISFNIINRC